VVQEHLILGVDEHDLQIEKSRWLTENLCIKVVETIIQQEPASLLVRIGGKDVPRLSMLVRYHTIMHSEARYRRRRLHLEKAAAATAT